MTLEDINKFLGNGEDIRVEFKEATDSVPSSFYETVVSFSNTDGGVILLGVNDDANVLGVNPNSEIKLQKDIVTALNARDCINPPLYVLPIPVKHPDGLVIAIQVPASSQVHDHAGKTYIREVDADIDITKNQQKVGELYLKKRNFFTETEIYPHLSMGDLDSRLFEKTRQLIRNYRSDHPWLQVDDEQMLRDSVLWRKDFQSGKEGLTLAAALIFGKDTTIQSILPGYKVEAMVRKENEDRWDDRINPPLRTNLIDTYSELMAFVRKHLPESFYTEGDQRRDLRDLVFREVIGNLIVHREYTSALSSELIIKRTEVSITNPNKPLFHGPLDPNSFNPYPKNPNIRKFFTAFGWSDEIGSGVRNTNKYLPLYAHGAKPIFIENDTFQVHIPLLNLTLANVTNKFIKWLDLPESVLPHAEKGFRNIQLHSEWNEKEWKDIILELIPSWHQKGTKLKTLKWSDNQAGTKEEIQNIPSWHEKHTKVLQKKTRYLMGVLALTSTPVKLDELLDWFEYKSRKAFRDSYLEPLQQEGLIAKTNPDKPSDPEQRYMITEKGKSFLGGL
jgi:ATP-dependent DNA helicase RecG